MQFRPPPPPQVRGGGPAKRPPRSDRDCPLDTARAAAYGTRVAWPARTKMSPLGGDFPTRPEGEVGPRRPPPRGQESGRLASVGGETRTPRRLFPRPRSGGYRSSDLRLRRTFSVRSCPPFVHGSHAACGPSMDRRAGRSRYCGHLEAGCPLLELGLRVTAHSTRYRRKEET